MTAGSPPSPPTAQQAERFWVTAHEHVRRGDFAAATRDLAQAFQILQALKDPRLAEVHKRWTEVHKLYLEDGNRAPPTTPAQTAQPAPNLEAEAEAAANAGNLEEAISLYERALARAPQNELVAERLIELRAARPRAAELTAKESPKPAPAAVAVVVDDHVKRDAAAAVAAAEAERAPVEASAEAASSDVVAASADVVAEAAAVAASSDVVVAEAAAVAAAAHVVDEADFGDIAIDTTPHAAPEVAERSAPAVGAAVIGGAEAIDLPAGPELDIHERATVVPQPAAAAADDVVAEAAAVVAVAAAEAQPTTAPPMAESDAPIGMGSLDVEIDMGEALSHIDADELPVSAATPAPAVAAPTVTSTPTTTPTPTAAASSEPSDPVEFLEHLLERVRSNRRAA